MPRIKMEQLNKDGNVFRTFEQFPATQGELAGRLHRITYAYNLARTRVSVDGQVIVLQRESGERSVPGRNSRDYCTIGRRIVTC